MKKPFITVFPLLIFICFSFIDLNAQNQVSAEDIKRNYHQFDFWLGKWDVYLYNSDNSDRLVGRSHIQSINDSTAILENYHTPDRQYKGKSLNTYNQLTGNWQQYWVDNSGLILLLKGGFSNGVMVMESSGDSVINKISWQQLSDGTVRQTWEVSADNSKSWTIAFDGIYRRIE